MNSFTILFGLALIAATYAHGHAISYAKRTDEHGHHAEIKVEAHHGEDHGHGHDEYKHVDYIHHPAYKFEYGVKDPKTGDHHSQWEHRDGDVVKGEYSLDEADGTKRIVKYSSDKKGGFTAHVERVGHASHPAHYGHHEEAHHH
ncbi:unnamed protein product [Chironomus riparius]|uniref:Uncharacterized protein n=1 Tax=Chironomus riparius TaxID=315576 RepID=A0A9N9S0K9_9DIPT|nr:unnamed protein product [Chironomus riparius]